MKEFLFLFFSCLTLLGAFSVVISRNAVAGVMAMIVAFVGISGLFLLLEAFLLAVLQIFVYAGAVMVLFLFVVMLLNIEDSNRKGPSKIGVLLSFLGCGAIASFFIYYLMFSELPGFQNDFLAPINAVPTLEDPVGFCASAKVFGMSLFTKYLLLVQVSGFLLLIAIAGVVHLAKNNPSKGPSC